MATSAQGARPAASANTGMHLPRGCPPLPRGAQPGSAAVRGRPSAPPFAVGLTPGGRGAHEGMRTGAHDTLRYTGSSPLQAPPLDEPHQAAAQDADLNPAVSCQGISTLAGERVYVMRKLSAERRQGHMSQRCLSWIPDWIEGILLRKFLFQALSGARPANAMVVAGAQSARGSPAPGHEMQSQPMPCAHDQHNPEPQPALTVVMPSGGCDAPSMQILKEMLMLERLLRCRCWIGC